MVLALGYFNKILVDANNADFVSTATRKLNYEFPHLRDKEHVTKAIIAEFAREMKEHNIDKLTGHNFGPMLRDFVSKVGMVKIATEFIANDPTPTNEKVGSLATMTWPDKIVSKITKFCNTHGFDSEDKKALAKHLVSLEQMPLNVGEYLSYYTMQQGVAHSEEKANIPQTKQDTSHIQRQESWHEVTNQYNFVRKSLHSVSSSSSESDTPHLAAHRRDAISPELAQRFAKLLRQNALEYPDQDLSDASSTNSTILPVSNLTRYKAVSRLNVFDEREDTPSIEGVPANDDFLSSLGDPSGFEGPIKF